MALHPRRLHAILLVLAATVTLQAGAISHQDADAFAGKLDQIQEHGAAARPAAARRTAVTESEVNSWFAYRAEPWLPAGVSQPQLTMLGAGRISARATVDLDAVGQRRRTGGTFDPWSYLGGRVPVTVEGFLHTENGQARFDLQRAELSGVPVPTVVLEELLAQYSRTPDRPEGLGLAQAFALPAHIRRIEVGAGQAVVVQ